jgi:hypothetical protein
LPLWVVSWFVVLSVFYAGTDKTLARSQVK